MKLEKEILSDKAFRNWAEKKVVLFKADFPRKTQPPAKIAAQNEKLKRQFAVSGFPSVILTDAGGKILGETGYKKLTPEEYTRHLADIIASKGRSNPARK